MSILDKINEIFCDIFDDESIVLSRDSSSDDIEDWDSLAQINIVVACEAEFGIKFEINDITGIKSVGDIIDVIERKMCK